MATKDFKRKLSAILSADVAGYSRLMGEDEAATVSTIETYREVMSTLIKQHRGRVVDSPGDNVLAEFASVVDAVQCGVAVQNEFQARNAELPENRKMQFRIGINLGDVIEEGDRIYGDGVNIAARLEALANPGGICISKTAFDHIETKLPLGYEYLGDQTVKNIAKPVGAYRVLMEPRVTVAEEVEKEKAVPVWRRKAILVGAVVVLVVAVAVGIWNFYFRPPPIEPASVEKMAYPLPDKPSIAVLPFVNMSGDPSQEYLSDGVTENIITALSNIHNMFVIARNSTFAYKGKAAKIQQVAEELGVRYVLEGSIQKTEDRVRITAQLIDAITGKHLWAERYDRDLKDFFALQDEITMKIITALRVKLTEGESANVGVAGTDNLRAYLKLMQASKQMNRWNKEGNALARKLAEEAIALDPEYADAYLSLSATHLMDMMYGSSESLEQSLNLAEEFVRKAISLRGGFADARGFLGRIYLTKRQYDLAIAEGERAVALAPNSSFVHAALAFSLGYAGRPGEAVPLYKKAIRLSPIADSWFLIGLGACYRMMGSYEEAISTYKKALNFSPDAVNYHAGQAANYVLAGHMEEAQAEATEVLRIDHKFSLESWRKGQLYKDQAYLEKLIYAMRKAGLPEHPPLPLPDKPSIAVLPFKNLSGESEQEFLVDGITESIIGAISRVSGLFVIASNSVFTYKGKAVKIQTVGEELGVQNVLEGTVQRIGNRLRVNAQLIDAMTGRHLWSEKYDREMKDLFSVQDNISKEVLTALQVKLMEGEQARVWAKSTSNLDAYIKFLRAYDTFKSFSKKNMILTRQICEEAITLDANYDAPYSLIGTTHLIDLWFGWGESFRVSMEKAIVSLEKGVALNPESDFAYANLCHLYLMQKRFDDSVTAGEKSVALNPNGDYNMVLLGITFNYIRRCEEAIPLFKEAQRRNPYCPAWYIHNMGNAFRGLGRWDEAIVEYQRALDRNPDHFPALVAMASVYGMAGRIDEGRPVAQKILKINPKWSLQKLFLPFKYDPDVQAFLNGLRKVGIPDKSPPK